MLSRAGRSLATVSGQAAGASVASHACTEAIERGVSTRRYVPSSGRMNATIVMLHGAAESGVGHKCVFGSGSLEKK